MRRVGEGSRVHCGDELAEQAVDRAHIGMGCDAARLHIGGTLAKLNPASDAGEYEAEHHQGHEQLEQREATVPAHQGGGGGAVAARIVSSSTDLVWSCSVQDTEARTMYRASRGVLPTAPGTGVAVATGAMRTCQ